MEITHAMVLSPCLLFGLTATQRVAVLLYIFRTENSAELLRMMYRAGTLELMFPGVIRALWDMDQGKTHHEYSAFEHCALCSAAIEGPDFMRIVAFAHDWGKVATRAVRPDGRVTFHDHAEVGAVMFETWAAPLAEAFAAEGFDVKLMAALTRHHMYFTAWANEAPMREATILKMVEDLGGVTNLPYLFALREADWATSAQNRETEVAQGVARHDILEAVERAEAKAKAKAERVELALTGAEIKDLVGAGPQVKEAIARLTSMVKAGSIANDKDALRRAL